MLCFKYTLQPLATIRAIFHAVTFRVSIGKPEAFTAGRVPHFMEIIMCPDALAPIVPVVSSSLHSVFREGIRDKSTAFDISATDCEIFNLLQRVVMLYDPILTAMRTRQHNNLLQTDSAGPVGFFRLFCFVHSVFLSSPPSR